MDGNVQGLWEQVYPTLTFSVKGESVLEMFDNLHAVLAKYDIQPIYDKNTVGQMVEDAAKLAENFPSHYAWNGILLSSHENALNAYREEKARADVYESMFNAAKLLPVATEAEQLQAKQNASLPALTLQSDANVSVTDGKVSLNGLSVKLAQNDVLEETATYVLKLALKKNTNNLEELAILDNLGEDVTTVYAGGDLALTLNGEFGLPNEIAEGEYSLVVYAANAADGIRISKFTEVICVGEVNAETLIEHIKVQMTVTPERIFKAVCENLLDVTVMLELATVSDYDKLRSAMEDAIISNGYFAVGATIEYYNTHVQSYLPIDEATPMSVGTYRIQYLAKADGGEVTAHVYCEIK